jgi:hypothetical protein
MATNLTIEGRAKVLPDIQRNWMWELQIPGIGDVTNGIMGNDEDLVIRARTAVIPSRGNEPIESNFIGMKQFFPGKPTFGHSFAVTIEETENQIVHQALTAWQNLVFNISPKDPTGGASLAPFKRAATKDIYLLMYKYNQYPIEKKIHFYNCFIQNIDDVSMDYTGNESVKFTATFQFDFWTLD